MPSSQVFRTEHLIVAGFQIGFDKASDVGLVLYDQDFVLVIAHRPHPLFPEQSGIPHRRPSYFPQCISPAVRLDDGGAHG